MDAIAEVMTAELVDELRSSERRLVDPRSMPARFHNLKAMGQSAAHCLSSFQDPDWKDTLALRVGKGVHAILFDLPIAIWTGKVRNGKAWDAFRLEHDGKTILTRKEHARAQAVADSIRRHHEASLLLFSDDAVREQTILWAQCGRARRSTPDVRGRYHVVELKTTRCAEPNRFCRDAMFRGYHAQLADQRAAIQHETGVLVPKAYIVAVETVAPYPVTVLELTERALERGAALVRGWLERLLVCEASGSWPAYAECSVPFDVPDDEISLTFGDEGAGEDEDSEP